MKILIVSGFLGAGKTTFLQHFIRRVQKDCVLVENEYGEMGIDGQMISAEQSVTVREVYEGCICCSAKKDFASSVLTIANALDPEVLLVEPSGVAMLGNILASLQKITYDRITLLQPVTVVDVKEFANQQRTDKKLFTDQIAHAGTVVLTKTEGAFAEQVAEAKKVIGAINPQAKIMASDYRENPDEWFASLLCQSLAAPVKAEESTEQPDTCSLTGITLAYDGQLIAFLQGVVAGVFGDIVRAKGYLSIGKAWFYFDVVNKTYSITGCRPMKDSRVMFIGKDLNRAWLRQVLLPNLKVDTSLMFNARNFREDEDFSPKPLQI
jgi:G3E family GTPase